MSKSSPPEKPLIDISKINSYDKLEKAILEDLDKVEDLETKIAYNDKLQNRAFNLFKEGAIDQGQLGKIDSLCNIMRIHKKPKELEVFKFTLANTNEIVKNQVKSLQELEKKRKSCKNKVDNLNIRKQV